MKYSENRWMEIKEKLQEKNIDPDLPNEYLHINWKSLRKVLEK